MSKTETNGKTRGKSVPVASNGTNYAGEPREYQEAFFKRLKRRNPDITEILDKFLRRNRTETYVLLKQAEAALKEDYQYQHPEPSHSGQD